MKIAKFLKVAIASATLLGAVAVNAGIINSKHDLSADNTNGATYINATNQDQLCVFCHTPHAANTSFSGAPLWNKEDTPAGTTYSMYAVTVGGTAQAAAPANPSKVCLSCHDGVSAINSVVNAPGSGSAFDYIGMDGGADSNVTTFEMPAGITQIGDTNGTNVDLTNDHPISIAYTATTKASLRDTATVLSDVFADINYTVKGYVNNGATINDLLRGGNIECVSCHDPHLGQNPTFLRVSSNSQSRLCITCHDK